MSQHDYVLANADGATFRSDLNSALAAIASTNSGTSRPSTVYAQQLWVDTNTPSATEWTLYMYDGTDDISIGTIDSTNNVFKLTSGAGSFTGVISASNGSVSAPALAFTSDTDTGIYRAGANALAAAIGGALGWQIDSTGLGIGAAPGTALDVQKTSADCIIRGATTTSGDSEINLVNNGDATLTIENERSGNVLIDIDSTKSYRIENNGVEASDGEVATFRGSDGSRSIRIAACATETWNAASAPCQVGENSSNNRSINAGGTVNASGADYAEYERKRDDCGPVAKGQLIGFDANGLVTDCWEHAISFGVKSTDPSYVGGDAWGNPDAIGPAPQPPVMQSVADFTEQEPVLEQQPLPTKPMLVLPPEPQPKKGERADNYQMRLVFHQDQSKLLKSTHETQLKDHRARTEAVTKFNEVALAEYQSRHKAWSDKHAAYLKQVKEAERNHAKAMKRYEADMDDYRARHEEARSKVDRIAYSGKVPCNVTGAKPGDWIVPVRDGTGISGKAVSDPSFEEYRLSVGQVRRVLTDGRAEIAVKVS